MSYTADSVIRGIRPLGFPWATTDPFLACMWHQDSYPQGNAQLGPTSPLTGRHIGQDFNGKDGWNMYHGTTVPGFPQHPHRGFETVTVVRRGHIDHFDSLGATARFGQGDVQWITAGNGLVHSEMFPLLDAQRPNPLDLFQIWLNLPAADKLAEPHFAMLWNSEIPRFRAVDAAGRETQVTLIAGQLGGTKPPSPPPRSWAARPEADVAIWTIQMPAHAEWELPAARSGSQRTLYFFRGESLRVAGKEVNVGVAIELDATLAVQLHNGPRESQMLLLQGRPIGEPVAQYGPFVMNTPGEIERAFADYRRTGFGGWPWASDDPVHPRPERRFARHADGRIELPAEV
jgi:redox-sensitive bicupin YhaK (pirin superfamily)